MAKGKARDESKERLWRRLIGEWRDGTESVRAFCDKHQLNEATFQYCVRSAAVPIVR